MADGAVTAEGTRLIEGWQHAIEAVERCRRDLNSADCRKANAEIALGRWLVPGDAKVGESFSVWYGDSLITAEVIDLSGNGTYKISVRKRGRSLS